MQMDKEVLRKTVAITSWMATLKKLGPTGDSTVAAGLVTTDMPLTRREEHRITSAWARIMTMRCAVCDALSIETSLLLL